MRCELTNAARIRLRETPRVVIVGGGFGGLEAAKGLRGACVDVTIIDKKNHHCFQPLLYQVATAALSPADVAWPIRGILGAQENARVIMAEVTGICRDAHLVRTREGATYPYDFLVVATGSIHSYFGHDEWAAFAPGLKRIEDAVQIRRRILSAFEEAEISGDPQERDRLLTFVIVGGGPTGVEMAGAIAELARFALAMEFRTINPRAARIVLLEAGPRLLPRFPEDLSEYAKRRLSRLGVEISVGVPVTGCSPEGVQTGGNKYVAAGTIIWAAGVQASPAAQWLNAKADRAGRVLVEPDLTLPGNSAVFVIGDTALVRNGSGAVPGLAPAAKQMGKYAAEVITARLRGSQPPPSFRYRHYGDLATIGRKSAVVSLRGFKLRGAAAWIFWCVAHIYYLIGKRNKLSVALNWVWEYFTFRRGARLIE